MTRANRFDSTSHKEIIKIMQSKIPDYTSGSFCIRLESDDSGNCITTYVEQIDHEHELVVEFVNSFSEVFCLIS